MNHTYGEESGTWKIASCANPPDSVGYIGIEDIQSKSISARMVSSGQCIWVAISDMNMYGKVPDESHGILSLFWQIRPAEGVIAKINMLAIQIQVEGEF